jgi:hypothetical protein
MSKICRLAVLRASMVALTGPAFAQAQPIRVGGLTCDAAPRVGLVVGSRQNLRCFFRSNATGRQYGYTGTIRRIGLDVGITGGKIVLGSVRTDLACRIWGAERNLCGCQRQCVVWSRHGRQRTRWRIPSHDFPAAAVGRRPGWYQFGAGGGPADATINGGLFRGIRAALNANGSVSWRPDEEKAIGDISERTERDLRYWSCCLVPAL